MTQQPRKQRNRQERAPLHKRQKQVHATLSDDLRDEYDTRRVRVRAGDTVEAMRGDYAGEEGEVFEVDLKDAVVKVEEFTVEKADGEEVPQAIDASNLRITDLDLSDSRREERLEGES